MLLPGLSKCVAIYYSASEQTIVSNQLIKPNHDSSIEDLSIENSSLEEINKFRNSKDSFYWLKKDEVPFEVEANKIIQMDVFSELEKNVLLLCLPSASDKKKDLIFCYFNENFSNFKISKSDKPLSTENKTIIGMMLYNSINTFLMVLRNELEQYVRTNDISQEIIRKLKNTENDLNLKLDEKQLEIVNYCNEYLSEISQKGKRFKFSDAALEKIKNHNGDISNIKKAIKRAVDYLPSAVFGQVQNTLTIEEYHLNFEETEKKKVNSEESESDHEPGFRYTKTIRLLDKLEEAANKVLAENKMLTSANVGNACETSITAPAISDALKKHKAKILILLVKHPDKWKTLKTEFRPLINILTVKPPPTDPDDSMTAG